MSSELRALWESAGGQVSDDWDVIPLESLLRDNKSIAVGVMYPGPDTPGGTPLIKVGDIKGGIVEQRPSYCISAETNYEYRRTQLEGDELLVTLVGNPGECVVVKPHMAGWNPARAIAVLRLQDPSLRTYLKTVLESSAGKHLIDAVLNTTVQKTLNLKDIRRLPIPLPSLETISRITQIAEAFSARITLLRETNATLEAIAQALFKSWFVDFDPVRAKMEGRAPKGMNEATAALFPESFEDTELGTVPRGWSVQTVENLAEKIGMGPFGSDIKVSTFRPEGVPVLNGKNLQKFLLDDECVNFISPEHATNLSKSCVQSGDIVITHRGTLGQVSLIPDGLNYELFVASQSQFFMRCLSSKMKPEWMVYFLRSPLGQHLLLSNRSQVGVPSIARPVTHLKSIKLVVPPLELIEEFSDLVGLLHMASVENRSKGRVLEYLRDQLLPRLISGQLRIVDVAEEIAA